MSVTIGRASLDDLYDLRVQGRRVSFSTEIVGSDIYGMQARRQQLAGLVDNRDEEVVPFTWSEDSSLDGFYRVVSVDVPSTEVMLSNGWVPEVRVELEQVAGQAAVWFEVSVSSVVRTNSHGITAPVGAVFTILDTAKSAWDLRQLGTLASPSVARRAADASVGTDILRAVAPHALSAATYQTRPSLYYADACKLEVLYGSTWYPVVGAQVLESRRWRISSGMVRLTAPNGATPGTLEVNDVGSWQSANVSHWNGTSARPIGLGSASTAADNPVMRVLRNSPEQVSIRLAGAAEDMTYTVKRGAMLVEATYTSYAANRMGVGYASANASTGITGGIRRTSNDANGNRLVFGHTDTFTSDLVNGYLYPTTSAALTRSMFLGVELDVDGEAVARHDAGSRWASIHAR
jgi:hypothetical protein